MHVLCLARVRLALAFLEESNEPTVDGSSKQVGEDSDLGICTGAGLLCDGYFSTAGPCPDSLRFDYGNAHRCKRRSASERDGKRADPGNRRSSYDDDKVARGLPR